MPLDGLLVVDKPVGPTSHDVVARVRRLLRERRIGHTGTLDPLASGVLLLVIGRATRLARFLTADAKHYEATIQLGFATDTYDALGRPTTPAYSGPWPRFGQIEETLDKFRGTFDQQPPAFSAKKIAGRRSYRTAREQPAGEPVLPAPVAVEVTNLELIETTGDLIRVNVACSSGFYVRSLAHDLGVALGMGAHLAELRRTKAGHWTVADAVTLAAIEAPFGAETAHRALVPLADVLSQLPGITLTAVGVRRAITGCDIGNPDILSGESRWLRDGFPPRVRLLNEAQDLVGIADLTPHGLLHPVVILM